MAKFTVKSMKHGWAGEIRYVRPLTYISDEWKKLVGDPATDVNTLALKALVIEGQRVCRDEKTLELAQAKFDLWRYKGGQTPPVKDLKGMEFSQAQIDILTADGTELINYKLTK